MASEDRFNGVVASLAIKAPCKAVSAVGNILLEGEQTVDTIAVLAGDRVLVAAQTDPVENGIYNVSTSAWQRSADFDGNRDVAKGTIVNVNVPPSSITSYVQINLGVAKDEPTIGTDPINFMIFFSLNNSLDDLSDVDLTGCSDDDMMHFVGGVLVCTLGVMTFDGAQLFVDGQISTGAGAALQTGLGGDGGPIRVLGYQSEGPQLRNIRSTALVPSINPRLNEVHTGIGGGPLELGFFIANNGSPIRALNLTRPNTDHTKRRWQTESKAASTTQTQGQAVVQSTLVRVTTVANDNDVITLLSGVLLGVDHIIMNDGANILQIFPFSGDDLGQGTNNPMTLQPGGSVWFVGLDSNTWHLISVASGSGGGGSGVGNFNGCLAYRPTTQSISHAVWTTLSYPNETYDTDNIHDNVTNAHRLTVPAGVTRIRLKGGVQYVANFNGPRGLRIRKDGGFLSVDDDRSAFIPYTSASSHLQNVFDHGIIIMTGICRVAAGDWFEMQTIQYSTILLNTIGSRVWFEMEIIQ